MLYRYFHKETGIEECAEELKLVGSQSYPILLKEYPRFKQISLPQAMSIEQTGESLFKKRESKREFDKKQQITKEELSTLLYYSAGIKKNVKNRRFYPSGGGLYPLEVYVGVERVENIPQGIYHYNIKKHSLEKLFEEENSNALKESLTYPWSKDAACFFIITAVWNRNYQKYKDFGYKMIFIEAGHMTQNLLLTGAALDLKSCPLAGFLDKRVDRILDIDKEDEGTIYIIAIGK